MKPFNVFLTACAFGFLGGVITGESAFAEDCKYQKNVQLAENGSILSADTTYECVKSQPIIVLDPVVSDVVVRNSAPVVVKSAPTVYGQPLSAQVVSNRVVTEVIIDSKPIIPKRKCYANWNTGGTDCYVGNTHTNSTRINHRGRLVNNPNGLDILLNVFYNMN